MRIFLTGATGYIGAALARRLAADGHELRALVRETSRTEQLGELGVACFAGDVTDRYSMREAMSGADWVIHTAAVVDFRRSAELMHRVNVEGSENVASLAFKLGVGRVLNLSSVAAFGGSPEDGSAGDEESPPALPLPSAYSVTKRAGAAAFAAWAERGLRLDTVYPGMVYGPPGRRSGANSLLWALATGRLPVLVGADRKLRWVHLDDLVEGLMRVMDRAPGASYLMTGDEITVRELAEKVCALAGSRPPRWWLAPGTVLLGARLLGPLLRLGGRRSRLNADRIRSLARHWNYDDARARAALDWRPRTLNEGLPETVAYLASEARGAA